ncbi:MAG: RIP metalloprotease RseP [Deltaproteobacteria bacterium]|nr:RIP metalloprotease RseP [Deltaproteobacteria bacterium]
MEIVISIIAFIIVLGVLIFIHELGHFSVAKWCGVGVDEFSLGFGPKVFGVKKGETMYKICAVPFGGYVKMVGEEPDEYVVKGQVMPDEVDAKILKKSFNRKPLKSRMAIVVAGSAMNLLLAFILFPTIFMLGFDKETYRDEAAVIGYVAPESPAAEVGIQKDDLILSVNGSDIKNWGNLELEVGLRPGKEALVRFQRDDVVYEEMLTPKPTSLGSGDAGLFPMAPPFVGVVMDNYPAKEAGIKEGDKVISVNGTKISNFHAFKLIVTKDAEEKTITVLREGKELSFALKPKYSEQNQSYLIGITNTYQGIPKYYGPVEAFKKGMAEMARLSTLLYKVIKGMVAKEYSFKTLGGPIMIAQVSGMAAQSGLVPFLYLMAFLSLQLGIINMLPFPALDGGLFAFMGIEALSGKRFNEAVIEWVNQIGFMILIIFMLIVTWNDFMRFFV